MNIKRIFINGFKNIDNVNVNLSKITGLLSINNFGKSNLLDAFDFALEFINSNIREKIHMMSIKSCIPVLTKTFGKNFKFEVEFESTLDESDCSVIYGYEFSWNLGPMANSKIVREYLKIKTDDTQKYSLYIHRTDRNAFYKTTLTSRCEKEIAVKDGELLVNKLCAYDNLFYIEILELLNDFQIYIDRHFDSENLYKSELFIIKENNYLSPTAENKIPYILNELKKNYKNQYELIINALKELFPYIEEIEIREIDLSGMLAKNQVNNVYPFIYADFECIIYVTVKNAQKKIQFVNMSDGVKRLLSILTYITLAELSNIPLIAIEEPENSIHPGSFNRYLITLDAFIKKTKVIITSHSPYLINFMNLSSIYIGVPNNDGTAKFRKIKDNAVSKINSHAESMDMMVGDYLFDLMSGYDEYDIQSLKKYLEND